MALDVRLFGRLIDAVPPGERRSSVLSGEHGHRYPLWLSKGQCGAFTEKGARRFAGLSDKALTIGFCQIRNEWSGRSIGPMKGLIKRTLNDGAARTPHSINLPKVLRDFALHASAVRYAHIIFCAPSIWESWIHPCSIIQIAFCIFISKSVEITYRQDFDDDVQRRVWCKLLVEHLDCVVLNVVCWCNFAQGQWFNWILILK